MEEDSCEAIFNQVLAGKRGCALSANVTRQGKSEFIFESQSQDTPAQSQPNVQVLTYEVNGSGEMLLLRESNNLVNEYTSHPTSSNQHQPLLITDIETGHLLQYDPTESPHQDLITNGQRNDSSLPSSLHISYNQELPIAIELFNLATNSQINFENTAEVENIRSESNSPTILNNNFLQTNSPVSRDDQQTEPLQLLQSTSQPSTSSVQANASRVDSDYDPDKTSCSSEDEGNSSTLQNNAQRTKRRKGLAEPESWKAQKNKKLREHGQQYIGWKRNQDSHNTHNEPRSARKIKATCDSAFCRSSKDRHCNEFTEQCRQELFNLFWDLTWDQKKIFVVNTVEKIKPKRPTRENTIRSATFQYYLKKEEVKLRVCKKMYLNTFDIGEWSVMKWLNKSNNGMFAEETEEQKEKKKRGEKKKIARQYLEEFLENLPKLPSHYCRKDSTKLYLEPNSGGLLAVYNCYKITSIDKGIEPLCRTMFDKLLRQKNICFQSPKKDLCDLCVSYLTHQVSENDYNQHMNRKNMARTEKEKDLQEAKEGKLLVLEQDVQAVKICPFIKASSAYYRRKLINHNFTIYEYPTKKVRCYWFSEVHGDTQASVFVSCVCDYLKDLVSSESYNTNDLSEETKPIVIWSDGCTYQNRNAVLANALSNFAVIYKKTIFHKYLEPGHTQMEVDSVHACIERTIKKYDAIYVPSQYADITRSARKDPFPYEVKCLEYDFFLKYDDPKVMRYDSIRPGKKKGDPVVTDLKAILYKSDGSIYYKTCFADDYSLLPCRPKDLNFPITYDKLFLNKIKLTSSKFNDLQALKNVIPTDYHAFYDNLPH